MNVLHINDFRTGGGCEVLVASTLDLLHSRGVETELFTIDDVPGFRLTPLSYIDNRSARAALRRVLNEFHPDVIHLHNYYHALSPGILREVSAWRTQRRCRVIMTAHDYHLVCPNSGGMWFRGASGAESPAVMRPMDPVSLPSASYLLTRQWDHRSPAHSMLKTIQHAWHYRLIDQRRVIDTVICPSRYMQKLVRDAGLPTIRLPHPAPAIEQDSANRYGPLRIAFAGRIEPEKGLAEFLRILPDGFRGTLTIIGDGSELHRCRAVAHARGLSDRVEFLGRLPHAQTMAIIARCHVLVLPSLCLENYPLSLIEALAAGTNILVSDHGGMKEMVEDLGVGFLFTPLDSSSLEAALRSINKSHADGSLNRFNLREPLAARSEAAFTDALLHIYAGHGPLPGGAA